MDRRSAAISRPLPRPGGRCLSWYNPDIGIIVALPNSGGRGVTSGRSPCRHAPVGSLDPFPRGGRAAMNILAFREPISAWSHGSWLLLSIPAFVLLWRRGRGDLGKRVSLVVFGL